MTSEKLSKARSGLLAAFLDASVIPDSSAETAASGLRLGF